MPILVPILTLFLPLPSWNGSATAAMILSATASRFLAPEDGGQDDGEFVAADARHRVGVAHQLPDPRGDALQQLVAGGVAEGVVQPA